MPLREAWTAGSAGLLASADWRQFASRWRVRKVRQAMSGLADLGAIQAIGGIGAFLFLKICRCAECEEWLIALVMNRSNSTGADGSSMIVKNLTTEVEWR